MCDTFIALPAATGSRFTLFAKNSDRPPNEAQYMDWFPGKDHEPGQRVSCTYLEIPQSRHTNAVLLSRPFWMWGGEMGVNQHGLAIGNEAVFSKIRANKEPALLGMDLLRLGLERARTAQGAIDVITNLLEEYGQGGNCVQHGHLYYHNSFLISDPAESWVLETVDRHWAAKKVNLLYSISNLWSLESSWDYSSSGLEDYIVSKGLSKSADEINISADLSDLIYSTFADGKRRSTRSRELMTRCQGEITVQTLASILRDHGERSDPRPGLSGSDICMHASLGPIRGSQTVGSMVAVLDIDNALIFSTGTAAPCTGIFKPFWVDAPPELGPVPSDRYDPETLYWDHERLHRAVIRNFPERLAAFQEERDSLEEEFIQGAFALQGASSLERKTYSEDCLIKAASVKESWLDRVRKIPPRTVWTHQMAWRGFDRNAGCEGPH